MSKNGTANPAFLATTINKKRQYPFGTVKQHRAHEIRATVFSL